MGRKKKHHDEHHGGAWKVAYADFVTAMMALFMVLWIVAQDEEIKIATTKYFQNPFNSPLDKSHGVMDGTPSLFGEDDSESPPSSMLEISALHELANEFAKLLNVEEAQSDSPIDIEVTSDGLRLTVYDRSSEPLFDGSNTEFTDWGNHVMQNLAWLLDRHEMKVRIDAHTAEGNVEDAWQLTTDQANAARRALEHYALDPAKVERITGFGDTVPLPGEEPASGSNQRLELSLTFD